MKGTIYFTDMETMINLLPHDYRCIMCRAEAHQLYAKKPIFDALGIQMFAVFHEHIESEVPGILQNISPKNSYFISSDIKS